MSNEIVKNPAEISVAAVEKYIALQQENCNKHQATIIVCANGKDLGSGVRDVFVNVSKDTVEIIIEDLYTIYGDCSNRFTTEDSSFSLICKTLQIKSKDALGCPITIEITGV